MLKAHFTDLPPTPAANSDWSVPRTHGRPLADAYAWESARLSAMREGKASPTWYGWVPQRSLSISRSEARRIGLDRLTHSEPPITEHVAIRPTGGTVVPQGPGTLNLTLFTHHAKHPGIRPFYDRLCAALQQGFATIGIPTAIGPCAGSFCDGDYNLLHEGKKLVGTAQRWATGPTNPDGSGSTLGQHHCVVMTGGDPVTLCARTDALYARAGLPDRADPTVHSARHIDIPALLAALDAPLSAILTDRGT